MTQEQALTWIDVQRLSPGGLGWQVNDRQQPYDRWPQRAEAVVRPKVWGLGTQSAGVYVDFISDASELWARWTVEGDNGSSELEAQVAWSGIDAYGQDDDGVWYWIGNEPIRNYPNGEGKVHHNELDGTCRRYRFYAPLRNRLLHLAVGHNGTRCDAVQEDRLPIVYYATSIAHGAGAGRPGLCHPSILSRSLDYPLINLGLCGNAKMEPEVAELVADIPAKLYVFDSLPNMTAEMVHERMLDFLTIIRSKHQTPILLLGDRLFGDARFIPGRKEQRARKNAAQKVVYEQAVAAGMHNLYLLQHDNWFGAHQDGTVDGSHCNDLGAYQMASALQDTVARLLAARDPA